MRIAQSLIKGCPVGATHGFDSSDNVKASISHRCILASRTSMDLIGCHV